MDPIYESYVLAGGASVLPPRAVEVEPELPAWSPSELEGVSAEIEVNPSSGLTPPDDPLSGVLGLLVGLFLSWLKGRIGRR